MQTCFNVSLPEVVVALVGGQDSHPVQQVVGNLDKPLIIIYIIYIFFSNKASYEFSTAQLARSQTGYLILFN